MKTYRSLALTLIWIVSIFYHLSYIF
jgi:hypothetical protein